MMEIASLNSYQRTQVACHHRLTQTDGCGVGVSLCTMRMSGSVETPATLILATLSHFYSPDLMDCCWPTYLTELNEYASLHINVQYPYAMYSIPTQCTVSLHNVHVLYLMLCCCAKKGVKFIFA